LNAIYIVVQGIEVAQCYLPHPEMGEYPGRDFIKVPEGSTSAAPSPPRAPKRQRTMDVVDDSEDFDDTHFISGNDGNSAIPTSPLSYRPRPRTEKKILLKFGIDAS
jgi:hypothetical protein